MWVGGICLVCVGVYLCLCARQCAQEQFRLFVINVAAAQTVQQIFTQIAARKLTHCAEHLHKPLLLSPSRFPPL